MKKILHHTISKKQDDKKEHGFPFSYRKGITYLAISAMLFMVFPLVSGEEVKRIEITDHNESNVFEQTNGWFTENKGQFEDSEIYFIYSDTVYTFGFVESGYLMKFETESGEVDLVKVSFEGSRAVIPKGLEVLPHKSNYFFGNDPGGWRTNLANYGRIIYEDLYEHIDLVFYSSEKGLKYDLIVNPDGNPEDVKLSYHNTKSLGLTKDGDLIVTSNSGSFYEGKPFSYQIMDDSCREIPSNFLVNGNSVSFRIGDYDHSVPLIVDPLIYSTFVGGKGNEYGNDIAIDSSNCAYIVGQTLSNDFPTKSGCYQETFAGDRDIFVFKLSQDGKSMEYSTYLGGEIGDWGKAITVDQSKNAYVLGDSVSSDFPTTNGCFSNDLNGSIDNVVVKLNPDGSQLLFSTYLGGSGREDGQEIVLDSQDNAVITGRIEGGFPVTPGCYDSTYNGQWDCYVCVLGQDGNNIIASTYVGGNQLDFGYGVTVDDENSIYMTGMTMSSNFPMVSGGYDESHNGNYDVFVTKVNSDCSDLLYSTYIGGDEWDQAEGIKVDSEHNTYITGYTESSGFPTSPGCYDDSQDDADAIVCKLNPDGSDLVYSTLVGGSANDYGYDLALDENNLAYVTGRTDSSDFPVNEDSHDDTYGGGGDIFIITINPFGTELFYSTFYGGGGGQWGLSISLDQDKNAYVTGRTTSSYKTSSGCYDGSFNGGDVDAFILKLGIEFSEASIDLISPDPALDTDEILFKGIARCYGSIENYVWKSSIDGEFYNGTEPEILYSQLSNGTHTIYFRAKNDDDHWTQEVSKTLRVNGKPRTTDFQINPNPADEDQLVEFTGSGSDDGSIEMYSWRSSLEGDLYVGGNDNFASTEIPVGNHIIYFKIKDDEGVWSDEISMPLTVIGKPRIFLDHITPDHAQEGELVSFGGHGIDDGLIDRYVWNSSIDGEFYSGTEEEFNYTDLSNGTHTIYFKAQDNAGLWSDELSSTLDVNGRPAARISDIIPDRPEFGETVQFLGNGTDDDSIVRYIWNSSLDGEIYNGSDPEFTISNLSLGKHIISLRVSDNEGIWSKEAFVDLEICMWSDFSPQLNPTPISKSDTSQSNPSIWGTIVTWQDYRYDGWDIFMFDIDSPEEIYQISNTSSEMARGEWETFMQTNPAVLQDTIYWNFERWDFFEHDYFIFSYNISDPIPGGNRSHDFGQRTSLPGRFSENWAAWAQWDDQGSLFYPYDLYSLNLNNGSKINHGDLETSAIALDGDVILYVDDPKSQIIGEEISWILGYNLRSQQIEFNVTIDVDILDIDNPGLWGKYIVWEDSREAEDGTIWDKGNTDIFFANLETGKLGQLTTDPSTQANPKVHGDTIIWLDERSGKWGLYAYSISRNKEAVLSENASNVMNHDLYGDWVVWEADSRIYLFDLSKANWQPSGSQFTDLTYSYTPSGKPFPMIENPVEGTEVNGTIEIEGVVLNMELENSEVQIKIEDNDWVKLEELEFNNNQCVWKYSWDTRKVENGNITIKIKAYNGETWSDEIGVRVYVNNSKSPDGDSEDNILKQLIDNLFMNIGPIPLIGYVGILLALMLTIVTISRKRKSGGKDEQSSKQKAEEFMQFFPVPPPKQIAPPPPSSTYPPQTGQQFGQHFGPEQFTEQQSTQYPPQPQPQQQQSVQYLQQSQQPQSSTPPTSSQQPVPQQEAPPYQPQQPFVRSPPSQQPAPLQSTQQQPSTRSWPQQYQQEQIPQKETTNQYPEIPSTTTTSSTPSTWHCPTCGKDVEGKFAFCLTCGYRQGN